MSGRWHVHLSPAAAAALRNVSKAAAATVADALDELSNRGPAAAEIETETARGPEWRGAMAAGDYLVTVAGRRDDARILVVSIDAADDSRAHRAVDVLPLELSTRRRLGGWLEGLDLDLRYTLRGLRRAPLFAAVVTGTLAIGFGGATAILDLVNTVYRSALPFDERRPAGPTAQRQHVARRRGAPLQPDAERLRLPAPQQPELQRGGGDGRPQPLAARATARPSA